LPPPPTSTLFPYTTLFRSLSKKFTKYRTPQPLRAWSADPLLLSSQTGHPPNRVIASSSIKPGEPDKVRFSFGLLLLLVFYLTRTDRKSTRLNSSHSQISYA